VKAVAILCVRNEAAQIDASLQDLVAAGLDVVLVDHDSTDDTVRRAARLLNRGLLFIDRLPWKGEFSLADQLRRKHEIAAALHHDWIVHADADEWLAAPFPALTLRDAFNRVTAEGFTCVNFDEFVFVAGRADPATGNPRRRLRTYYFYEPHPQRLMRAWHRTARASNVDAAGHRLTGEDVRVYPRNFILRHYIGLSHAHLCAKYVGRRFSPAEIARGWHQNRLDLTPDHLHLKPSPFLRRLRSARSQSFDRSRPARTHFWEWT
jgi:glycosyltransferase involved in cell wall biosynthesis